MLFNTPTCTESFEGAIFKGAKTYSEGVLISVRRQTVWDHWEHGHKSHNFPPVSPAVSLSDQITGGKISTKLLMDTSSTCGDDVQ